MTRGILLSATALGLLVGLPHAAAAEELATQLVGVWKLVSSVQKDPATGETANVMGEKPGGHFIFTRGGYFAWNYVADGRKAPAGPVPTEAERVALFNTASFGAGTWRVEGTMVSFQYSISSNQLWTGTERRAPAQVSGKTLTITSAPFRSGLGKLAGKDVVVLVTLERQE